jgi:choline transport protein
MEDAIEMNTRGGPSARDFDTPRHSRTKSDLDDFGTVTRTSGRSNEMTVGGKRNKIYNALIF